MSEYLYLVQMDVPPELEAEFNRLYDEEHIPEISKLPGVLGARRYALETPAPGVPKYAALFRVDSAELPGGPAWRAAADSGEWKTKIRPHTFNRSHALFKALS